MTVSGSYNVSIQNITVEKEIERLHSQVILSWEKEAQTLKYFGVQDQISIIELGSGPGFYTEQLLNLLPHSQITALEIDPVLVEYSQKYLQNYCENRLKIVPGSVLNTNLPKNSFDIAIARLVFEHISQPEIAFKETWRILKPGGKLVLIGGDRQMMMLTNPTFPEFEMINQKAIEFQIKRGGDPYLARKFTQLLQIANFSKIDLQTINYHSQELGIEPFLQQFKPQHLLHLSKLGMLSKTEAENTINAIDKFLQSPHPFILMFMFMACGEKAI
ncbi:methyltransferase domain-containing protein [Anabaena sp. FACHB-1237]|uniref:class I SAM-dependent methyltransferase n=1 Tax=Anabaena sp. FACHB-1237 TaxID=2692769 RepID=UPI00167FF74F|nr:class I SAM-dependent methyltransferase [Anabaena sp. FACHB-1237]MBD2137164.1 methyltransferase domain-containing protein [Anabaena sp. FACHB-1237]